MLFLDAIGYRSQNIAVGELGRVPLPIAGGSMTLQGLSANTRGCYTLSGRWNPRQQLRRDRFLLPPRAFLAVPDQAFHAKAR